MKTSDLTQKNTIEMPPYPPSFLDRFMRFIQRLPIPYWWTYLILFILQGVINLLLAWIDGWLPVFKFNAIMLTFPLWQWGTLAIMTYLNTISEATLSSYRPLLNVDDGEVEKLKSEFTTMPTRGLVINGFVWIVVYVLLTYLTYNAFYVQYGLGKYFQLFTFLEGLICFSTGGAIYYHSLRQLWLVNRTVKMTKHFNLFHLDPIYAFSRLTSRTGISWIVLFGLNLLTFPLGLATEITLTIWGFQLILAVAAFVLPLRFVNFHLVAEKRRLLAENQRRVESTLTQLHQHLDQNELSKMEQLNNAITGLNAERDILAKIPTWPWRTETLTGFLSAVALPILLLIIQIAIQKWLSG
jgi:hypothetical protein